MEKQKLLNCVCVSVLALGIQHANRIFFTQQDIVAFGWSGSVTYFVKRRDFWRN
jgi:hypothetical protein